MEQLSGSTAMAVAAARLESAGFRSAVELEDASGTTVRVFEDRLSIVALSVYGSWANLEERWTAAQGLLVELMSEHLGRREPKSWEGYLVLLTTDRSVDDQLAADRIRRDTTRVRKLVATGHELTSVSAVEDALLPVLPLELGSLVAGGDQILGRMPELLREQGADEGLAKAVVDAFRANRSPMDAIWQTIEAR
jgi:hypothetical protein